MGTEERSVTQLKLTPQLALDRCPHCGVAKPTATAVHHFQTASHDNREGRFWRVYQCTTCGGVITAASPYGIDGVITEVYPKTLQVHDSIPDPARSYLSQSLESAPAGAVMLAASAVDAMLKAKGLKEGKLYTRIELAAEQHLITSEMAAWAHEVRLDANEPRHADEEAPLPSGEDARKARGFAYALAEFLFVLPAKVERGRKGAT